MSEIKINIFFLIFIFSQSVLAQSDTTVFEETPKTKLEGYTEAYYCYDFNKPTDNLRPGFIYNHARHNEVNVNHAIIRASYTSSKVRVNMAIMTGN